MNIPLIIPNFNLLTYTKNIINWWRWYYPEAPVYIVDNGSNYEALLNWYNANPDNVIIARYPNNTFIPNLTDFLRTHPFPYYVISDPDIMPHPNTPPNFIEIWKEAIDKGGYHHAGFDLLASEIPSWNAKQGWIQGDEAALHGNVAMQHNGFNGYKAPIDTTFALYKSANGGWYSPMNGHDWGNSLRLFNAYHLPWHLHPDYINPEMDNYFRSAKYRVIGEPSAGMNNSRPQQYEV